ncbi:MAG: patatin-like phospholipase family protein [Flavobacteriaceae bacterium]|nr:patatin-like phospholipase family protein [Flavobacteriaceae bacterium]
MKRVLPFLFIGFFFAGYAQKKLPKTDLKVGLVLSGGGAKGFAHIGAIKVLEEAGVRIDYIGGTSMGAIVGALYAAGYNANQLDSIITHTDFTNILQDKLPRSSKSFYQKENDEKYVITLPIKGKSIGLPSAISKGQNVFNLFSRLTEHVHDIQDFNNLPIPFLCIATDLETGKPVVLNHGFLPEVIRASGSFPTLLEPVEIDGKLLADGGIANNFPVQEVINMGADVIIGIDVQNKLKTKEQLNSAPKIVMQIINFNMYSENESKKKLVDVYIHPKMKGFNVVSFDKAAEIIKAGEVEALKELPYLKSIAKQQSNKLKLIRGVTIYPKKRKIRIKEIEVEGLKEYSKEYLIRNLDIKVGDSITFNSFKKGVERLSATDNFKTINYKFIPEEGGNKIIIEVEESLLNSTFSIGGHYDNLFKTGVILNYKTKGLFLKNDVLSTDFVLGDNVRYLINYYVDNGFYWNFGFRTRYVNIKDNITILGGSFQNDNIVSESEKIPLNYNDFTTQFYAQTTFGQKFITGLGLEHKYLRAFNEPTINGETRKIFYENEGYFNAYFYLKLDTYDAKYYPKKGVGLSATYRAYLTSSVNPFSSFTQLDGTLGFAKTFKKYTFQFITEAGATIGNNKNPVLDYHLGGVAQNLINTFRPFYGYDIADLNENGFLKSTFILRKEIFKENYLSFIANYARIDNDLFNRGNLFQNTKSGYAISYGINSFLGPIELVYAWSPDTSANYWYLNFGFWF